MSDIEILLDEENTLQFEVEIQGISTKRLDSRFVVETPNNMDLSFDGSFEDGKVKVAIPILAQVVEADTYKCRLEFILEGEKYFAPMETEIDFIMPVKVRAGLKGNTVARKKEVQGNVVLNSDSFKVTHQPVEEKEVEQEVDNSLAEALVEREIEEMKRSIEAFNKEIESKEGRKFEVKNMPVEIKEIKEDGTFSGYGSVFGVQDSYNDIVEKGAFKKTLNERTNVKLLWQHDSREPIGVFTKMYEDDHGLVVEGKIAMDVQRGKEAYTLIKMGAVDGLSIGYSTITAKYDKKTNIRFLKELKLYEVSVVTFPANEAATVTSVKSDEQTLINNFIKSLQSRQEPIANHSKESELDHSKSTEADDNSNGMLEQLVETLKLKKGN